ncbi:MAG TPA: alpha/beta hydrolase-fold protein, partial [Pirellulales bacterium]|nr:alpha/beta hydrolase-fold protein [Pirellulales bacterium]
PGGKPAQDAGLGMAHYTAAQGETHTALFAPMHYEPNYAYPLLVWLHPAGDDESQLKRIMPLVSMRNYVAVAPRAPQGLDAATDKPLHAWPVTGDPSTVDRWNLSEQLIFDAVELAQTRFHIASRRIFVAGYDGGGTMAFRLAMDYPQRFAGVLSLCGRFPSGQTPLKRISLARQVPVFLACGRDSRRYASAEVCEHLKLFHSAGMNVSLRQYPCGHEMVPAMLGDMDRWMMEQIAAASAAKSEDAWVEDFDLFER